MKSISSAIYARVSTLDQTVDNQVRDLRSFADRRNLTVANVYRDEGISGATRRRPELDRMIQDAKKGEFGVLLVWRVDRLGRSLKDLLDLLDALSTYGVDLVSFQEPFDTTTPAGKLFFQMAGAFSQYEREMTRERISAGLRRAKQEGQRIGRPPLDVSLDEVTSLRESGHSIRSIARMLQISKSSVSRLLRNSVQ